MRLLPLCKPHMLCKLRYTVPRVNHTSCPNAIHPFQPGWSYLKTSIGILSLKRSVCALQPPDLSSTKHHDIAKIRVPDSCLISQPLWGGGKWWLYWCPCWRRDIIQPSCAWGTTCDSTQSVHRTWWNQSASGAASCNRCRPKIHHQSARRTTRSNSSAKGEFSTSRPYPEGSTNGSGYVFLTPGV